MKDLGFLEKLIKLTKCIERAKYRVKVYNVLPFTVDTGLKLDDSLSPVLFNIALEQMVKELQVSESGI